MSGNHNQDLDRALKLVDAAADAGAHALKLQTYTPETITLNSNSNDFLVQDRSSLWSGQSLYSLYEKAFTPWEWHLPIFQHAKQRGLICFSSPFDESAVDFLEELDVPAYKIASFENNHIPLIRKAAATGKPIIISTGMASLSDLENAVNAAISSGCTQLVLLKCTSSYPASPLNSNINTIPHLSRLFNTQIGISDHTLGVGVAVAAVALGASVIEKHFTLSRADGGVDSAFSLEPDELKSLVVESNRAWESLGCIKYGPTDAEKSNIQFRRSIYVHRILKGDLFSTSNIRIVRPGHGAPPHLFESLLGKSSPSDFPAGTPLSLDKMFG